MASDTFDTVITRSQESDRPSLLPSAFEPFTRSLFIEAGLKPGMHILDVCSGTGDAAFLAREIVGPKGRVTAFDASAGFVSYAKERASFRNLSNVDFVEAQLEDLPFGQDFDAIVGRLVLMYRSDPVDDLRRLCRHLRPRGVIIFQELDMLPGKTVPPAPVIDEVRDWVLDVFARSGIELEMGPKLYAAFKAAGLPPPQMRVDCFIGGAESICPELVAHVARILLPQAQALDSITAESAEIDTLEQRMRADLARTGGVMSTPLLIGAWATVPQGTGA